MQTLAVMHVMSRYNMPTELMHVQSNKQSEHVKQMPLLPHRQDTKPDNKQSYVTEHIRRQYFTDSSN